MKKQKQSKSAQMLNTNNPLWERIYIKIKNSPIIEKATFEWRTVGKMERVKK